MRKDWNHMGTHLRVLGENYPMNTNMTRFKWIYMENLYVLVLWMKVASEMEGLTLYAAGG